MSYFITSGRKTSCVIVFVAVELLSSGFESVMPGGGARLRQIIAGVPTTCTQDLAAPLPVVLQAKTGSNATQYLYAMGTRPIAQYTSAWEYLLPDALGSVRQIADANPTPLRYRDFAATSR
jgi:hypothetical protein